MLRYLQWAASMTNDHGKLDLSEVSSPAQPVIQSNPTLTHSLIVYNLSDQQVHDGNTVQATSRHLGLTFNPPTCSNNHLSTKILQIKRETLSGWAIGQSLTVSYPRKIITQKTSVLFRELLKINSVLPAKLECRVLIHVFFCSLCWKCLKRREKSFSTKIIFSLCVWIQRPAIILEQKIMENSFLCWNICISDTENWLDFWLSRFRIFASKMHKTPPFFTSFSKMFTSNFMVLDKYLIQTLYWY